MASDKKEKPPAEAPQAEGDAPKKGGSKTVLVAGIVVILEVITVVITMMLAGGPRRAVADTPTSAPAPAAEKDAEVKLVDAKLPGMRGGVLYLYDLQVVTKVGEKNQQKVTDLFKERDAEIHDHIRAIIASADPKALGEPGLETLRRQISYQLEQDVGKDLIKEVLIPKCTPIRAEY